MKRLLLMLVAACVLAVSSAMAESEAMPIDNLDDEGFEETITDARELQYGDEGEDVREVQQRLADLGYDLTDISGRFDDATRKAIRVFQEDFALDCTGEADALTQSELFAAQYRPLKQGMAGENVTRLQTRLAELGFYKGKISGKYLEATQGAVSAFQQANGEEATGIADTDTLEMLFQAESVVDALGASATPTPAPAETESADGNVQYTKRLAKGSAGELVKQLQTRLTELGYYTGPISGNFQGKTAAAVKKLQKQNAVGVDGIVGEITWNLIFNDDSVLLAQDTPRPTPTPTPVPYAITVDVNNQVTTVYGLDEHGEHTVVVREMLCSTGRKATPSDPGDWTLTGRKAKWCYFPKWGGHARYWTRINSSIAFHSVIYNSVNTMDLATSSYKNLGKRASHGCIRLTVADAKWIYDNCGAGTVVSIVENMPDDPELRASLKLPPLNKSNMLPQTTPEPTPTPAYTTGATPPLPLTKLQKNDSSEAVYWMQRKLKDLGYYTGKCSGTFLAGTQNAVKAFQKAAGLRVTGVATEETLEALYAQELATATPEPTATPAPTLPQPAP